MRCLWGFFKLFFQLETEQVRVSGYPQQIERNLFFVICKKHLVKLFKGVNPIWFTCLISLITNCSSKGMLVRVSILDWHRQIIWSETAFNPGIKLAKLMVLRCQGCTHGFGETHEELLSPPVEPAARNGFLQRHLRAQGLLRPEIRLYPSQVENPMRPWTC